MKLCIIVLEHVLAPDQPAVEQRQPGSGHHQDQRGADQHPRVVAGALRGFDGLVQIGEALFEVRGGLRRSEAAENRARANTTLAMLSIRAEGSIRRSNLLMGSIETFY